MAYKYTNSKGTDYYLHSKEVRLRSGRQQRIYYFAKSAGADAVDEVPGDFVVVENPRTGLPVLRRKS